MKKHTEGFHFSILKAPKRLMIVPKVSMKQETAPKTLSGGFLTYPPFRKFCTFSRGGDLYKTLIRAAPVAGLKEDELLPYYSKVPHNCNT